MWRREGGGEWRGGKEREGKEGRKGGREEGRRYSLYDEADRRRRRARKRGKEREVETQTDLYILITATGSVQGQLLLAVCYGYICLASQ